MDPATIRFAGAIPELYDRHLGPVLFEPYAVDLAARLPAHATKVLEVAAGTGRVTRHLLARIPATGRLVATDLNDAMIARGARSVVDPRLSWQVADAQQLPVDDATFDAVVCQFGLMFVPDLARALREMRRALGLGGVVLLNAWDALARNPASAVLHQLAVAALPANPPLFMSMPFSLHDRDALVARVREAGFTRVEADTVARDGIAASAADLARGFVRGNPLFNQLVDRALDIDALEREVTEALAARFGAAPCVTPMSAHVITAAG